MELMAPFADEMVGSILSRAVREHGLGHITILRELSGKDLMCHSLVHTRHAGIAKACHMSLETFLKRHTSIRYALGFMEPELRERMWARMKVETAYPKPPAALGQSAIHPAFPLRFCPACLHEDLRAFGMSYWRRVHQLPGVTICAEHRCHLVGSDIALRASIPVPPPEEVCQGHECSCRLGLPVELAIARWSSDALSGATALDECWAGWFRQRAIGLGYVRRNGSVYTELLAQDLETFYGAEALAQLGCGFSSTYTSAWPGRLVRPHMQNIEPLKHVLLGVFLTQGATPSADPVAHETRARGPEKAWTELDQAAVAVLREEQERLRRAGKRSTIENLMKLVHLESGWRYSRARLPLVSSWVQEFKKSDCSERQMGTRSRLH